MPSCPHVSHNEIKKISDTSSAVSYCRESCSRTFFFCRNCGEANRTLARYCRACGEPVSFAEAERAPSLSWRGDGKQAESYALTPYGVREVYSLHGYSGHLIVVADSGVITYDVNRLHEPLDIFRPPDGSRVRAVADAEDADDRALLVTTARQVLRRSMLNLAAAPDVLYQTAAPSDYIYHSAVSCSGGVYLLEYSEADGSSRFVKSTGEVLATFRRYASPLQVTGSGRIFFCTEEALFVYDAEQGAMRRVTAPERLNLSAPPAYNSLHSLIFLVGETKLWRMSQEQGGGVAVPLKMEALGDPRLATHSDHLLMVSANGLYILSPFGEVRWSTAEYFINAASDGRAPQVFEDRFTFTALGGLGGSNVYIHSLRDPQDFELVPYEKPLMCQPVVILGRLFAAVGDGRSVELRVR